MLRYERMNEEHFRKNKTQENMKEYYFLSRSGNQLHTVNIGQVVKCDCKDLDIYLDLNQKQSKIRTMSYHRFGYLVKRDNSILEHIDLIVIDEAHNLLKYSDMNKDVLTKNFKYAKDEEVGRA